MNKSISEFYYDIGTILKLEHIDLANEFQKRIKKDSSKDIFLWLDNELKGKSISPKLDELLTDFFFSIH